MKTETPSQYDTQAADFLAAYGVNLTIRRADPHGPGKTPAWVEGGAYGNQYKVRLSGADRRPVSFDFWGSINDRKADKDPSEYDVLACLSGDINCPETFNDFCEEYGYGKDSRSAFATFKRCLKLAEKLQAFFTTEAEREALSEIQ